MPAAVEAKHQTLDNVSSAVAEYSTVTETAENLLKSVDDAAAKKEPFGTADEQLRKQQVGSSSAGHNRLSRSSERYIVFFVENYVSRCFFLNVKLELCRQLFYVRGYMNSR